MKDPTLEMRHISKRFDMTQALDDVSLTLYPGEIHALVGENGAGKSTLIKIMTGIHRPDQGEIRQSRSWASLAPEVASTRGGPVLLPVSDAGLGPRG